MPNCDLWITAPSLSVTGVDGRRPTIEDEAELVIGKQQAASGDILRQLGEYRIWGGGMLHVMRCGWMVRKLNRRVVDFEHRWWRHLQRYTHRDQMSFPVAARDSGLQWASIDSITRNTWTKRHKHLVKRGPWQNGTTYADLTPLDKPAPHLLQYPRTLK
jgi:hypothetical protein